MYLTKCWRASKHWRTLKGVTSQSTFIDEASRKRCLLINKGACVGIRRCCIVTSHKTSRSSYAYTHTRIRTPRIVEGLIGLSPPQISPSLSRFRVYVCAYESDEGLRSPHVTQPIPHVTQPIPSSPVSLSRLHECMCKYVYLTIPEGKLALPQFKTRNSTLLLGTQLVRDSRKSALESYSASIY